MLKVRPWRFNRGQNLPLLTEDFCSRDWADWALKLVARIVFHRNTISPAASLLSSTIAHKQFQILLLSLQAQIKENITHCFFPCLLRAVFSRLYLKTPVLCGQGYIVTLFDWCARADKALSTFFEENLLVIRVQLGSKYKSMNQNPTEGV